jgi:hypothetical protein
MTYLNTSLRNFENVDKPAVKFWALEPSYALLTFRRDPARMTVELKSLDGKVLDRTELGKRKDAK